MEKTRHNTLSYSEEITPGDIKIRKLDSSELSALEWGGEYTHFRRMYHQAFLRMRENLGNIWVAVLPNKKIIGQVIITHLSRSPELADGKTRAYLWSFRVIPQHRSHGIGSRMLDFVHADLLFRGFRAVTLTVAQQNSQAIRLYERHGYKVFGSDPGPWHYVDNDGKQQDVYEASWRMMKVL
jgi:ribosomal protein S18 acetylase RimI-like enzyme